eukprot:c25065_g2_i1 orf=160-2592(+)
MLCNRRGPSCCPHLPICTVTLNSDGEQLQKAFRTLQLSDEKGIPVSRDVIYSILQECIKHKVLSAGNRVHNLIVCRGLDSTTCFNDHLIRLFASCGSLPEANHVFKSVAHPRTYTWNAIISAHVNLGQNERALDLYQKMLQARAAVVDKATLSCILKACSVLGAIEQGRAIHGHVLEEVLDCDVVVMNTLVVMYAKCCSIEDAWDVFDGLRNQNVVSWGAIICGYSEQGYGACALELFEKMQFEGLEPSRAVYLAALKACSIIGGIIDGRKIHDQVIRSAFGSDLAVESTLIDTYAKCGSLDEAYAVFQGLRNIDVVSWGAMIAGYADNGQGHRAFEAYKKMQETAVKPNTAVFLSLLQACSSVREHENGMLVHEEIKKCELDLDLAIRTGLIDMYSRCGSLAKAQKVFNESFEHDSVMWGAIITACVQHGRKDCAVELFERMIIKGTRVKAETFISLLKACDNGPSYLGWLIHDEIIRGGHQLGVALGSALVDMYGKYGYVEEARCVFDRLRERNVISWGGMIAGYVQQGLELNALALFNSMLEHEIKPDRATLSCIVKACCAAGAIEQGRKVHDLIVRNNYELDTIVNSSLVDMYAKFGSLSEACKVFDGAACRDVVLWGVIIGSCCLHGNLDLARQYMNGMETHGLKPSSVIFTSMLASCCYAGKLVEGLCVFKSMREDYGIVPDGEHYSCMIDLLSRAGCLNDAQTLLKCIPYESDLIMGTSLLTGCKTYGNVEIGSQCFEKAFEVDSKDASAYALMSQINDNECIRRNFSDVGQCVQQIYSSKKVVKGGGLFATPGFWYSINSLY